MIYLLPDGSSMQHLPTYFHVMTTPYPLYPYIGYTREWRCWALDNGAYTKGEFEPNVFFDFLERMKPYWPKLFWMVIPDAVGDCKLTDYLYHKWITMFRYYPLRVAFVAQDGITLNMIPQDYDCMFIGGTNNFKQSEMAAMCMHKARQDNKWVHVGRVNTWQRLQWAYLNGAHSVDGTCIAYGRDKNMKKLLRWMKRVN